MCSIGMSGETYGVLDMGPNKKETRGAPRVKVEEWSHDDSCLSRIEGSQFRLEQFGRTLQRNISKKIISYLIKE